MVGLWSREDLLRAFDLLTKAEQEIRVSDQPRYNLEMALLRLMHLRKLVPLSDLLAEAPSAASRRCLEGSTGSKCSTGSKGAAFSKAVPSVPRPRGRWHLPSEPRAPVKNPAAWNPGTPGTPGTVALTAHSKIASWPNSSPAKSTFYNLVVASAFRIDATAGGHRRSSFLPNQKNAKSQCEEQKAWLQSIAEKVAGQAGARRSCRRSVAPRRIRRGCAGVDVTGAWSPRAHLMTSKAEAMANSTVQAVLEIFPVEKTTIEERYD